MAVWGLVKLEMASILPELGRLSYFETTQPINFPQKKTNSGEVDFSFKSLARFLQPNQ